jgi:hypothetical protein
VPACQNLGRPAAYPTKEDRDSETSTKNNQHLD